MTDSTKKHRWTIKVQVSENDVVLTLSGDLAHHWRKIARKLLVAGRSEQEAKGVIFTKLQELLGDKGCHFRPEFASGVGQRLWNGLSRAAENGASLHISVPRYEVNLPDNARHSRMDDGSLDMEQSVVQALEEIGLKDICQRAYAKIGKSLEATIRMQAEIKQMLARNQELLSRVHTADETSVSPAAHSLVANGEPPLSIDRILLPQSSAALADVPSALTGGLPQQPPNSLASTEVIPPDPTMLLTQSPLTLGSHGYLAPTGVITTTSASPVGTPAFCAGTPTSTATSSMKSLPSSHDSAFSSFISRAIAHTPPPLNEEAQSTSMAIQSSLWLAVSEAPRPKTAPSTDNGQNTPTSSADRQPRSDLYVPDVRHGFSLANDLSNGGLSRSPSSPPAGVVGWLADSRSTGSALRSSPSLPPSSVVEWSTNSARTSPRTVALPSPSSTTAESSVSQHDQAESTPSESSPKSLIASIRSRRQRNFHTLTGMHVLAMNVRQSKIWQQGVITTPSRRNAVVKIGNETVQVGWDNIALTSHPCGSDLSVGSRVIGVYGTLGILYGGVIAEIPCVANDHRFLVFFDDGFAQYLPAAKLHQPIEEPEHVWRAVDEHSQDFIKAYLDNYPKRTMVELSTGQKVMTEWRKQWHLTEVAAVDASLVKMIYVGKANTTKRRCPASEWIYRGNTRLKPVGQAQNILDRMSKEERLQHEGRNPEPLVVTLGGEDFFITMRTPSLSAEEGSSTENERMHFDWEDGGGLMLDSEVLMQGGSDSPLPQSSSPQFKQVSFQPSSSSVQGTEPATRMELSEEGTAEERQASPSPGESVFLVETLAPVEGNDHESSAEDTSSHSANQLTNGDCTAEKMSPGDEDVEAAVKANKKTNKESAGMKSMNLKQRAFELRKLCGADDDYTRHQLQREDHTCTVMCGHRRRLSHSVRRQFGQLTLPLCYGWKRILRHREPFGNRRPTFDVMYMAPAPCNSCFANEEAVVKFLRISGTSPLTIDMFCFDPSINVLPRSPKQSSRVISEDIAEGLELMPVQCVNDISHRQPPELRYQTEIVLAEGVHCDMDSGFLVGCDCADDCFDKTKCRCQALSRESVMSMYEEDQPSSYGYTHRRVRHDNYRAGIYECNPNCRCSSRCHNRVVQNGIQIRLQLFMTKTMGWGIRCLDDIPNGSFICTYVGRLMTSEQADAAAEEKRLKGGDETADMYMADLDHIEVAEHQKAGYESDVALPDDGDTSSSSILLSCSDHSDDDRDVDSSGGDLEVSIPVADSSSESPDDCDYSPSSSDDDSRLSPADNLLPIAHRTRHSTDNVLATKSTSKRETRKELAKSVCTTALPEISVHPASAIQQRSTTSQPSSRRCSAKIVVLSEESDSPVTQRSEASDQGGMEVTCAQPKKLQKTKSGAKAASMEVSSLPKPGARQTSGSTTSTSPRQSEQVNLINQSEQRGSRAKFPVMRTTINYDMKRPEQRRLVQVQKVVTKKTHSHTTSPNQRDVVAVSDDKSIAQQFQPLGRKDGTPRMSGKGPIVTTADCVQKRPLNTQKIDTNMLFKYLHQVGKEEIQIEKRMSQLKKVASPALIEGSIRASSSADNQSLKSLLGKDLPLKQITVANDSKTSPVSPGRRMYHPSTSGRHRAQQNRRELHIETITVVDSDVDSDESDDDFIRVDSSPSHSSAFDHGEESSKRNEKKEKRWSLAKQAKPNSSLLSPSKSSSLSIQKDAPAVNKGSPSKMNSSARNSRARALRNREVLSSSGSDADFDTYSKVLCSLHSSQGASRRKLATPRRRLVEEASENADRVRSPLSVTKGSRQVTGNGVAAQTSSASMTSSSYSSSSTSSARSVTSSAFAAIEVDRSDWSTATSPERGDALAMPSSKTSKSNNSLSKKSPSSSQKLKKRKEVEHLLNNRQKLFGDANPFIMDAKEVGNLGRYFNHSCDPNMAVVNVFYKTHDLRFPTIAFFAQRNIRAMTELCWDYGYEENSVEGRCIDCRCGAANCRGRLL